MALYLGIDGGGTKTTCAVGDDTSTIATITGPGGNVIRVGEAEARKSLQAAISQGCCEAKVSPLRIQAACVGAAGAGHAEVAAAVKGMVRNILPNAAIQVVGDMVIAHEATLHGEPGVLVIAGTGSIAYGRNAAGETARAGGWGFQVSDEGSGQWIGRKAVTEALRAFDANESNELMDRIIAAWKLPSRDDLIRFANNSPTPNFSELFPVVQQAADEGDGAALRILSQAAEELCSLARIVLARLWKNTDPVKLGVAGGVFANSSQVREAFERLLKNLRPNISVSFELTDPVLGALSIARKLHAAETR
jgi:glucosamine kinase